MHISSNFSPGGCQACRFTRQTGGALFAPPIAPRAELLSALVDDLGSLLEGFISLSCRFPGFGSGDGGRSRSDGWSCALTGQRWEAGRETSRPASPKPGADLAAAPRGRRVKLRPLAQSNSVSCGQTSVAMSINALTGKKLTDRDIQKRYGFSLLQALNAESRGSGYSWKDGGNLTRKSWSVLEQKINKKGTPVLIGLNGPAFSPSGRGHIVTLIGIEGEKVTYADPADGKVKTTTRRVIEQAPPHPDGKFLFYVS